MNRGRWRGHRQYANVTRERRSLVISFGKQWRFDRSIEKRGLLVGADSERKSSRPTFENGLLCLVLFRFLISLRHRENKMQGQDVGKEKRKENVASDLLFFANNNSLLFHVESLSSIFLVFSFLFHHNRRHLLLQLLQFLLLQLLLLRLLLFFNVLCYVFFLFFPFVFIARVPPIIHPHPLHTDWFNGNRWCSESESECPVKHTRQDKNFVENISIRNQVLINKTASH